MKDLVQSQKELFQKQHENRARLLVKCPDQPGIVAAISTFLHEQGANIIESSQYSSDPNGGIFFIRMEFELPNLKQVQAKLEEDFHMVAQTFARDYCFRYVSQLKRTAIFVSNEPHCLLELLWE